jgi:hypothetical protein
MDGTIVDAGQQRKPSSACRRDISPGIAGHSSVQVHGLGEPKINPANAIEELEHVIRSQKQ